MGRRPDYPTVKSNCARFGRIVFGSASSMQVRHATDAQGRAYWEVSVLSEGHPVHDTTYTTWMHAQWTTFFEHGFGVGCEVQTHARLEAGDRQDGRPSDQLIVLPSISLEGD